MNRSSGRSESSSVISNSTDSLTSETMRRSRRLLILRVMYFVTGLIFLCFLMFIIRNEIVCLHHEHQSNNTSNQNTTTINQPTRMSYDEPFLCMILLSFVELAVIFILALLCRSNNRTSIDVVSATALSGGFCL